MLLLRTLSRLVGMLWMLALGLLGLGIALYCFDGLISLGSVRPDRLLHLSRVRRHVGHFLGQLAAPGTTATLALLCGLGAMLIGLLLLIGTLRPSRRRLAVLDTIDGGTLAARRRPLRSIARVLAQRGDGVTSVRHPRLTLSRHGNRGRLKLNVTRAASSSREEVERAIHNQLTPISEPFHLRPRIRVHAPGRGDRVQ